MAINVGIVNNSCINCGTTTSGVTLSHPAPRTNPKTTKNQLELVKRHAQPGVTTLICLLVLCIYE